MTKSIDHYENTILLIFNTSEPHYLSAAYIKYNETDTEPFSEKNLPKEYALEQSIHSGMIQDSVLIYEYDFGTDLRFFPYIGNRCSFYMWFPPEGFEVFILNESKEAMEFDTPEGKFLVKPGEFCHITEENKKNQITESIAPRIDRWNSWDMSFENGMQGYIHFCEEDAYETDERKFEFKEVILKEKIVCPACGKNNFILLGDFSRLICHDCKKTYEIYEE